MHFSLSSTLPSVGRVDDKLKKRIGHSLSDFCQVEGWQSRRQAEGTSDQVGIQYRPR